MPKKMVICFVALVFGLALLAGAPMATGESTITDNVIASIKLPVPQDKNAQNYLGLAGEGSFVISQIKAEVVLIEIFNMYCNNCQREAPRVNDPYRAMNKDSNLKDKIKMIGIGVGNTPLEVEVFHYSGLLRAARDLANDPGLWDRHWVNIPAWTLDEYLWELSQDPEVTNQHHRTLIYYY